MYGEDLKFECLIDFACSNYMNSKTHKELMSFGQIQRLQ